MLVELVINSEKFDCVVHVHHFYFSGSNPCLNDYIMSKMTNPVDILS